MVGGGLGAVGAAAISGGDPGLSRFRLNVLSPLGPMLAQTAEGLGDALSRISPAWVEWKLDGARLQVHRLGAEVRAFTRNLADVTRRVPEIIERVSQLDVEAIVLDGEAIALRDGRRPHPFQVTMGRFGSRLGVEELRVQVPLSLFAFDCLHLDGQDLLDRPGSERFAAVRAALPEDLVVPRIVAAT